MQLRFPTLTDALHAAALHAAPEKGYTFLSRDTACHINFQTLWVQAQQYASALQQRGVRKGDCVLMTLPTSEKFAVLYWALQLCGAVPCVLPGPGNGREQAGAIQRILDIGQQIGASAMIVSREEVTLFASQPFIRNIWDAAKIELSERNVWQRVQQSPSDLAMIQATSGSTGEPKCVALTQANIMANLEQIGCRLNINNRDVQVCWLPLFHDMGLVGCFHLVLYWKMQGVFLTPFQFLRDPKLWLQAISDYKGTISPAPNFAYALVTQRIPDAALAQLDLSSWKAAVCGAEPIDVNVLQRFAERFKSAGFNPNALVPAYGMAEAALCLTMYSPGEALKYETISRTDLAAHQIATPSDISDPDHSIVICDCGPSVVETRMRITDDDGNLLPDGHIGRIEVAGPSIMEQYINLPSETARTLKNGWLDTGDLGYLRNGRLFVTGRVKDLIIIRGHNYASIDFERVAEEVPGIAMGRVVAVGVLNRAEGTEQLVILCEQNRNSKMSADDLQHAVQIQVGKRTGVLPAAVMLLPRNAVPRTTSGKLQRGLAREMFLTQMTAIQDQESQR